MFLIHRPLLAPLPTRSSTGLGTVQFDALAQVRRNCLEQCTESACAVLKEADAFVSDNTVVEKRVSYFPPPKPGFLFSFFCLSLTGNTCSDLVQLVLVSICIICYYLVSGHQEQYTQATLTLGSCCGLLGKLRPDDKETAALLIDSALDLIHVVRSTRRPVDERQAL